MLRNLLRVNASFQHAVLSLVSIPSKSHKNVFIQHYHVQIINIAIPAMHDCKQQHGEGAWPSQNIS